MSSVAFGSPSLPLAPSPSLSIRRSSCPSRTPSQLHRSPRCAAASPPGPAQTPAQQPQPDANEGLPQLSDWRDVRARLVAAETATTHLPTCWAHRLAVPEVGSILLANATHSWPDAVGYLNHAVVLVTQLEEGGGVSGFILNRPTGARVVESRGVLGRVGKEFADNEVRLAGDANMGHVDILHGRPGVAGATEVVRGVWHGGLNGCRQLVQSGLAKPEEFCVMISYARWSSEQLSEEMMLGAWTVASVAPEVLLEAGCGDREWKEHPQQLWKKIMALLSS